MGNDVWALGLMFYELTFGHLPPVISKCRTLRELEQKVKSFSIASDTNYKKMAPKTAAQKLVGGMLTTDSKSRMSIADALKLAYELVGEPHVDSVGKLPDCFFGKDESTTSDEPEHEVAPVDEQEGEETHESLDDVDFFTLDKAMTNIGTNFMFNSAIVDPTSGIVVATNSKLQDLGRYGFRPPLQQGFVILEVNDKAFASLTDADIDMLKNGMWGSTLTFKFSKK